MLHQKLGIVQKQGHGPLTQLGRVDLERGPQAKGLARRRNKSALLQTLEGIDGQGGAPGQIGDAKVQVPAAPG